MIDEEEFKSWLKARIEFYSQKGPNYSDYVDCFQMLHRHYFNCNVVIEKQPNVNTGQCIIKH